MGHKKGSEGKAKCRFSSVKNSSVFDQVEKTGANCLGTQLSTHLGVQAAAVAAVTF